MHTNIAIFIQTTRIFKILLYIYSQNVNINAGMNNKVTINPQLVIKYDFKHIFTYRLLYHIMIHYDRELRRVRLNKAELVSKYGRSDYSVIKAIEELKDNGIVANYNYYKDWYSVNNKIFINFINGVTK